MFEQNRPKASFEEKWKNFQYMTAHCYPGSIHPKKLCVCFADATASQDVIVPLLLDYGKYVALAIGATYECGEFEEPTVYDMVDTKENTAKTDNPKVSTEESAYCGLTGCEKHEDCTGPQRCFLWKDFQYLIAHTSPAIENEHDLKITYFAKDYDNYSMALFSRHMSVLVYCVQAIFEYFDDFDKVSVQLSSKQP